MDGQAALKNLTVVGGVLMPTFEPGVMAYTATVPRGIELVTVKAVAMSPTATVAIDGETAKGRLQVDLPGSELRRVVIIVTSEDHTGEYTTILHILPEVVESTTRIVSSQPAASDVGHSVAISGDTLVMGAYGKDSNSAVFVFERHAGEWLQQATIQPTHMDSGDNFGGAVALDGDTLVVGAYYEDGSIGGVNGDETDNGSINSGAAYVFVRTAGAWTQQAYLKEQSPRARAWFGQTVSISGDTVAVGAPVRKDDEDGVGSNFGSVSVFSRSGTDWSGPATLRASKPLPDSYFGSSLSLSGGTLVVGARGEGSAAVGVNGGETGVGASGSGAAYVFVGSAADWTLEAFLKASDTQAGMNFGASVALSGDRLVVGAPWPSQGGCCPRAGAAYLFERAAGDWRQTEILTGTYGSYGDLFGQSVASDGERVAVASPLEPYAGSVLLFQHDSDTWYPAAHITHPVPGGGFARSLVLADGKLAVGSPFEEGDVFGEGGAGGMLTGHGAVYVYDLSPQP